MFKEQRKSLETNNKVGNLTTAIPKTFKLVVTKIGVGDDVGDQFITQCKSYMSHAKMQKSLQDLN